jgi:tetratricopeptide (TPR) repeat protein
MPQPAERRIPWPLLLVLAYAVLSRAAYLAAYLSIDPFASVPLMDAARYDEWARTIAHGASFESGPFYQAPLYPYLLGTLYALAGLRPWAAYVAQMTAGVVTLYLLHRVALRAYGERAAILAASLGALYGVFLFNETKLLPVAVTVLLATLAVERVQAAMISASRRDWTLAGITAGLAALASAGLLLMAGAVAIVVIADRGTPWAGRRRSVLLFVAGLSATIAPVAVRNLVVGDDFVLVAANGGVTFYQGNNPAAIEAGGGYVTPDGFTGSIATQREESRHMAEQEDGGPLRDSQVSRHFTRKALQFMIDDPLAYAHLLLCKLLRLFDSYEPPLEYNPQLDPNRLRYLAPLPFGLILALASTRVFAGPVTRRELPILLLAGAQSAILLAFFVAGRYRLPLMPALIALAGAGLAALIERRRDRPLLSRAAALAAGLGALSLVVLPRYHRALHVNEEAQGWSDRAFAYSALGKKAEAVALSRRAVALVPDFARGHTRLGKALLELGDLRGAEEALQEAARLDPADPEPLFDLGTLAYRQQRMDAAADFFTRAHVLAPDEPEAIHNAVAAYLAAGHTAEAAALWREARARGITIAPSVENRLAGAH